MLYIVAALSAEARPIIERYKLKRIYTLPFTMFQNSEIKLIISGMGLDNAMMATTALLSHYTPTQNDLLVNIGICAAPENFKIGNPLVIHQIHYEQHSYFPDILFEHPFYESDIITLDAPSDTNFLTAVDMESYGVYKAAARFLKAHQILFFKIVSDSFEPQSVTKELALELVSKNIENFETFTTLAQHFIQKEKLFSADEEELIEAINIHLTKSQSDAFYDACCYYKLHQSLHVRNLLTCKIAPPKSKLSKKERSQYLEQLIKTLTV